MVLASWKVWVVPAHGLSHARPKSYYVVANTAASAVRQAKQMAGYGTEEDLKSRSGVREVDRLETFV